MKTNSTLNNAFPIVAAALGNKLDVKVSVSGTDAKTDGHTIHLPAYNADDPNYKEVAWGFLAHEAGHVRFTDMEPFQAAANIPIRKDILNLLEDIRIEKLMQDIYPGTARTLGNTVRHMIETGGFPAPGQSKHPAHVLLQFMLYRLRCDRLGQGMLSGYAAIAETCLEQTFPEGLVTRLMGLMSLVPTLTSTRECLSLTDRILRMLEDEREKAERNQNPGQNNGNDYQEGQNHSDDVQDQSDTDQNLNDDDQVQDQEDADSSNDQSDEQSSPSGESFSNEAMSQLLQNVLSAKDDDLPGNLFDSAREFLGEANSGDYDASVSLPVGLKHDYPGQAGEDLYRKVVPESRRIRAALNGFVESHLRQKLRHKSSGNRLDGRKAYRLAVGNPNLFVHIDKKRAPNTAFHILLDGSSSMEGRIANGMKMIDVATDAAMALALALEGISGVNPAVTRFPNELDDDSVVRLLDHGQKVRATVSAFKPIAEGMTPLHSALWYAAAAVMATRETRKIIMVLTDGEPDDHRLAVSVIKRCEQAGIELIGVGIAYDTRGLFKTSVKINDVTDLRGQLLSIGRDMLLAA